MAHQAAATKADWPDSLTASGQKVGAKHWHLFATVKFCCPPAATATCIRLYVGIPGSVEFEAGRGGLPTVVLKHACGASAQVCVCVYEQAG